MLAEGKKRRKRSGRPEAKRGGKNTKEDVLVEVVRLSRCGKRSRGGVSAKGNLKQADASGTGKHAARHMRIDAKARAVRRSGSREALKKSGSRDSEGETTQAHGRGTQGQPEAPGPREKRDYRWQWRRGSPVSIPNTEVKPFSADGTWRVTARKSRSLPVLHKDCGDENFHSPSFSSVAQWQSTRLLTGLLQVRVPPGEPIVVTNFLRLVATFLFGWCTGMQLQETI